MGHDRTGKLTLDSSAGAKLHYLEGASRILAGGFSGLLASLAVKTGIILSMYDATSKLNDMMILTAFAAGAAERLAPSIVSQISVQKPKIENEEDSGHKDKKND
jgi:predicted Zn-dependent peptidase